MSKSERPYTPAASRLLLLSGIQEESGDDLNPVLVSGFGRLSWVGADGGLTGFVHRVMLCAGSSMGGHHGPGRLLLISRYGL